MRSYTITDACAGCTLCAKNCPVGAISGKVKEKHTIDENRCIRCGLCGRLCAKGAVLDEKGCAVSRIPKAEWKKPYIASAACVGCSVCIEACPRECIQLTAPEFQGDIRTVAKWTVPEACIGCGLCANVCPIGAIHMLSPGELKPVTEEKIMKKNRLSCAWCRTFQLGMKLGNYVIGYRMPEYIEGPGSIKQLPAMLKEKGADNVLVVTDSGLVKLGLPNGMLEAMEKAGITYTLFSDVSPNPTSEDVEKGFALYRANGCKALVAFGGGSPMDCAKAIGAKVAHPNKTVAQLQGLLRVHKKVPLFFAVPTTAGTGSETTVAAVITDAATHHKASINDPCIIPKYAVLDPELTVGLPPFITATTGLDALAHAVEAYTNHTYNTRLENDLAIQAVKLIHDNLLTAYRDGSNMEARQNMQKASFFAGRAFTRGCVGYVHALGHTLGGLYGVAHGLAMSILLPHVMRAFGPAVYTRLAELADACGMSGSSEQEKAEKFISWIEDMKREMNLPVGVDMIQDKDIEQIIDWAMKEANPLYPVPVVWGREDFRRFLDTVRVK